MVTDRPVEEPRATPLQSEPEAMPVQSKPAAIIENVDESMSCASRNVLLHPQNVYISAAELLPFPKAAPRVNKQKRRMGKTTILTDTPERNAIESRLQE